MTYVGKRTLDLFITVTALIALAPLLLLIILLVWFHLGSPVLFKQRRVGLNGKSFVMLKFRTMTNERDAKDNLLPDADRLIPLGRFLRNMSLDELPELFNVLTGNMSIVGPRPLLVQYLGRYSTEQSRRHEVYPGITGWAQINGRNALSWEEKFKLDVWYVDNCSLALDLKIIFLTAWKVLCRHGISHEGEATMPEFRGCTLPEVEEE